MSRHLLLLLAITWLAFLARAWQLDVVPPGWSDDELSNIYVLAQKIFAGDYSVYYNDATGLEAPYHIISGLFLRLFGFNVVGIRLFSAYLGLLTVPLTYQLGRRLFNRLIGLIAAAALAVSFWSLIYSRVNLRHIGLPVMALGMFWWFWGVVERDRRLEIRDWRLEIGDWRLGAVSPRIAAVITGLLLGGSLYTYFAARGLPLILGAFVLYLVLFDRARVRRRGRALVVVFGVALLVALPLIGAVQRQTGADARVVEVAVPLVQASQGNFEPLQRHIRVTLSMFHADGDDEHLYNIPHRPVFGPINAIFFWLGVAVAAWHALGPLRRRLGRAPDLAARSHERAAAFLLLWWAAGIAPGFLSVPPASLGHTILAQPASYLLLALPVWQLARALRRTSDRRLVLAPALLALLLVGNVARRDLPDYFVSWPQQGMTRFLYHADLEDVAQTVAQRGAPLDFAISGLLAGPWDRLALELALQNAGVEQATPRWYHAQRAAFLALSGEAAVAFTGYPNVQHAYESLYEALGPRAGGYRLSAVHAEKEQAPPLACFQNGLCLQEAHYEPEEGEQHLLHLTWRLQEPLQLPPIPLLSKPPPPDVYAGPRLQVFAQRWRAGGQLIAGDDGLWVDPLTLHPGDLFRQQHQLGTAPVAAGDYLLIGLYDPMDGRRILTLDERDSLRVEISPPDGQ